MTFELFLVAAETVVAGRQEEEGEGQWLLVCWQQILADGAKYCVLLVLESSAET